MSPFVSRFRAWPLWVQVCAGLAGLGSVPLVLVVAAVLAPSGEPQAGRGGAPPGVAVSAESRSEPGAPAEVSAPWSISRDGGPADSAPTTREGADVAESAATTPGDADVAATTPDDAELPQSPTIDPPELPSEGIGDRYIADGALANNDGSPGGGEDRSDGDGELGGPGAEHDAERERRAAELAERFPAEAAAGGDGDRWALIVGVNAYQGSGVRDTFGSVPDARVLADLLTDRGWPEDQVLVLTDADATGEMIRAGIEWLADRTDDASTVVVSFSGHLQHRDGVTALWPTDHDYLWADEVGARFAEVDADRMWLSFQGCHAQGLSSPQLHREGRVITYSSKTAEKSHEDPETGHSVQGHYLFAEALGEGDGDPAAEPPSVQQAFGQAAPRTRQRTADQQTPQIWDGLDEPFRLGSTTAGSSAGDAGVVRGVR